MGGYIMKGFEIKCIHCNKIVGCKLKNKNVRKVLAVFVKAVVFRCVGFS